MPSCHQKSSMATPGGTRSSRGHRTLSTRLPMVSMSRASESLVGAWANSCRVTGRLSMLMMARQKSSKACSIGSISREQVGHGTSTSPYASRNSLTAAAIYGQNVVVLQPNVVSISSSLVWKAEVFQNVQLHEGVDVSIRSHQWRFSSFMNTD